MTFRNILVYVDDTDAMEKRSIVATELAARFDAHVTGLCLAAHSPAPSYMEAVLPSHIQLKLQQELRERATETKDRFCAFLEARGARCEGLVETCLEGEAVDVIGLHARYADLLVLGQPDPKAPAPVGGWHLIETVILSAGRPAIVVPYIGAGKSLGEGIAVAWDAGREAARAVSDAMPLLERAKSVSVLVVNPEPGRYGHGEEPGSDIARHLARHGIKATVNQEYFKDVPTGDAILSQIADTGADLLVMGAYGHSRLRELVLGGVTQTILRHMTVPVFMSH